MKHVIYILMCAAFLLPISISASDLVTKGDSAYTAGQYAEAIDLYNAAIDEIGTSSDLLYNLGNAYYRQRELAKSIIAYERALRLNPTNKEAKANLEIVNSKIVDKKGDSGSFLSNAMNAMALSAHSNTWAWVALVLFMLTAGAAALYIFGSAVLMRKIGFFGGFITLIATVWCVIMAVVGKNIARSGSEAVITAESTILSTSPRVPKSRAEEAMLLHEGTKLSILDSLSTTTDTIPVMWYDVQVDNNHRAWIKSNDLEII